MTASDTKRILIADEDGETRIQLGMILAGQGYEISHAVCGREAIALHQNNPFDLVITELGIKGFEKLKELQRHSPPVKFIATSKATRLPVELRFRLAAHLGAHSVFAQPVQPEQLLAAVQKALQN